MRIAYRSDMGRVRRLNEDSVLCLSFEQESSSGMQSVGLFVVADGMGGHSAGEVASELGSRLFAAECLQRLLGRSNAGDGITDPASNAPEAILQAAVGEANRFLFQKARERQGLEGMGTTITAALVSGQDLYVIHVGDSRCYIINDRETIQITRDHSVVQEMVDSGMITEEEARTHPRRNVITRVLGYYQDVVPDSYQLKLFQGDNILICSDGLCGVVPASGIAGTVLAAVRPAQACAELVAQANQLGGPDNISVVLIKPDQLPSWQEMITTQTEARRHPREADTLVGKPGK